jgi:uncharacterized protein
MARFLLFAVAVYALVWLLKRSFAEPSDSQRAPKAPARSGDELVRCEHCGLHLPRAEAHERDGKPYCSEEHARLGPRGGR